MSIETVSRQRRTSFLPPPLLQKIGEYLTPKEIARMALCSKEEEFCDFIKTSHIKSFSMRLWENAFLSRTENRSLLRSSERRLEFFARRGLTINQINCSKGDSQDTLSCLRSCPNLTSFTMNGSRISRGIIEQLLTQKNLEHLDFSHCDFDYDALEVLTKNIEKFERLNYLDLSKILIEGKTISNPQANSLASSFESFGSLKTLKLAKWPISRFTSHIEKTKTLEFLDASHCDLRDPLGASLLKLPKLKKLNLSHSDLQVVFFTALGDLIRLEYLDVSGSRFTSDFSVSLGKLRNLKYLNLSERNSALHPDFAREIGKLKRLQHLNLSNHKHLNPKFASAIGNLDQLEYLNLSNCNLGEKFEFFIPEMGKLLNLRYLNLSQNDITSSEMADFAPYFENFSHLKTLNLAKNSLGSGSSLMQYVSSFLGLNSTLKTIALSLEKLVDLESLDLSHNFYSNREYQSISESDVVFLFNSLQRIKKLRDLKMGGPLYEKNAIPFLISSFKSHPRPITVSVEWEAFADEFLKENAWSETSRKTRKVIESTFTNSSPISFVLKADWG